MTVKEKAKIEQLRHSGMGYMKIAQELNLPVNTVKSYCYRNPIGYVSSVTAVCKHCGKPMESNANRPEKKFCSDVCRMKWWTCHHNELQHHKTLICVHCGKSFYGKPNRKYCSHQCYTAERFGAGHVTKAV